MNYHWTTCPVFFAWGLLALCSYPLKAEEPGATVSASGRGELEQLADRLRVSFTLESRATTMEQALERLTKRRQEAGKKLAVLEADEESMQFEQPQTPTEILTQREQMFGHIRQQMRGDQRARNVKLPEMVVLQQQLTAEWDLPQAQGDEYLLACHQLAKAIRDADVGGAESPDPVPPAVEEMLEELGNMSNEYSVQVEAESTNRPQMSYLYKISAEQHAKTLADAFADAQRMASLLADATGHRLGTVHQLQQTANLSDAENMYMQYMSSYSRSVAPSTPKDREAIASQPGKVVYELGLQVVFELAQE